MTDSVPGVAQSFKNGVLTVTICHTIPTGNYQTMRPELSFSCDVEEGDVGLAYKQVYRTLRSLYSSLLINEAAVADGIREYGIRAYVEDAIRTQANS